MRTLERDDGAAAPAERVLGGALRARHERQAEALPWIVAPFALSTKVSSTVERFAFWPGQVVVHRALEPGAEARLRRVADDVGGEPALRVDAEVERAAALLLLPVRRPDGPVAADLATVDRELRDPLDLVVLPVGEVAGRPRLPVGRRDDERDDHADAGEREPRDLLVHGRPRDACMFARLETSSSSASRMKLATTLEPP